MFQLALLLGAMFLLQGVLSVIQMRHFSKEFVKLRRQGKVACGRKSGGFHAGAIVLFRIDEDGVIQEGRKLMGVTCFARVTDVGLKRDEELRRLRELGYDGLTLGVETGDEEALAFMNKGYGARDVVEQAGRLDEAGMSYSFFYLAGISGAGRGVEGALRSAEVFNQTRPRRVGSSMLTIFPSSALYREIQAGRWREESELEKLEELKTLIENLEIPTRFETDGASNLVRVQGELPQDRERLSGALDCRGRRGGPAGLPGQLKTFMKGIPLTTQASGR